MRKARSNHLRWHLIFIPKLTLKDQALEASPRVSVITDKTLDTKWATPTFMLALKPKEATCKVSLLADREFNKVRIELIMELLQSTIAWCKTMPFSLLTKMIWWWPSLEKATLTNSTNPPNSPYPPRSSTIIICRTSNCINTWTTRASKPRMCSARIQHLACRLSGSTGRWIGPRWTLLWW